MKSKSCFIGRKSATDLWTMSREVDTKLNAHMFLSVSNRKQSDEVCEDRSMIAQPMFVFKKERPHKRPAEDPVWKTENVFIQCSRKRARSSSFSCRPSNPQPRREIILSPKRARSSSFTVVPRFPPSQPVKKNNVFMTSALLQKSVCGKATEKGCPSPSAQRDVLKPAILQPPQAALGSPGKMRWPESVTEDKLEAGTKVSTDKGFWTDCSDDSPCSLHISGPTIHGNQLTEGRTLSNSRNMEFVFGENIVDRVLSPEKTTEQDSAVGIQNKRESTFACFQNCFLWTTPVLASDATLVESAAAYTFSKPTQRYLLHEVKVTTGEEAEHNVLQINCKLFLFNKALLSWTERGSGSLRLNDMPSSVYGMLQSRLVMRNQGSMKLILNTKLWTQMVIERANRKNICITATDLEDSSVKIFLIQASSKDAGSLYTAIHHRLVALRSFAQKCDASQVEPGPEVQPVSFDSDEEENEEATQATNNTSDHSQWIRKQPVVCS